MIQRFVAIFLFLSTKSLCYTLSVTKQFTKATLLHSSRRRDGSCLVVGSHDWFDRRKRCGRQNSGSRSVLLAKVSDKADDEGRRKKGSSKKKSTKIDRVIDDFLGKRYGAGSYFYGARTSEMSEEEYAAMRGRGRKDSDEDEEDDLANLRDNAIMIVGSLKEIGQWVAFELGEKGFKLRIVAAERAQVRRMFGASNDSPVDAAALGDGGDAARCDRAVEGTQAIVFCPYFAPPKTLSFFGRRDGDLRLSRAVLAAAVRARKAGRGSVQKILMISRALPEDDIPGKESESSTAGRGLGLLGSVASLLSSSVAGGLLAPFRREHLDFEAEIRQSGIEYTVVRAPPLVVVAREGARNELLVLDREGRVVPPASSSSASSSLLVTSQPSDRLGVLDLAEVATQALLLEGGASDCTFTVCETRKTLESTAELDVPRVRSVAVEQQTTGRRGGSIDDSSNLDGSGRVSRDAYFGVLSYDDPELKINYLIREPEVYMQQMAEDEKLEGYWLNRLQRVPKD